MAYFLRAPRMPSDPRKRADAPQSVSTRRGEDGSMVFVHAAPLVAHDRCTHDAGSGGHPWDEGREAFDELAGAGWDWCWDRRYTINPETAPPCFYCGDAVLGEG